MKKYLFVTVILNLFFLSCGSNTDNNKIPEHGSAEKHNPNKKDSVYPVVPFSEITSSFNSFWTYWCNEVFLTRDFIALNTDSAVTDRKTFLHKLTSGKYVPVRLNNETGNLIYKLYKINQRSTYNEIIRVTKQYANRFYIQLQTESKPLPDFSFKDINGNIYNKENCKGKIVILNCWFIHCLQCVREISDLNQLAQQYRNKNIVFIA